MQSTPHDDSVPSFVAKGVRAGAILFVLVAAACTGGARDDDPQSASVATQASALHQSAVGLAIEIDNGSGVPLQVKRGQRFYLNQIDVRAAIEATVDEGVDGLAHTGDFADLRWGGTRFADESFILLSNPDGTFTRRRFYRGGQWMRTASTFTLRQLDAHGTPVGAPMTYRTGTEERRSPSDDFFVRRLRAIQWTRDCAAGHDCSQATSFEEEGLVELRNAMHPERTFVVHPHAAALSLTWSADCEKRWTIPLTQVDDPPYAYGLRLQVDPITPPQPNGTYAPGSAVEFRVTFRDGAGNRLHPEGSLPTYNEVVFGPNPAGLQYYRAFFDPTTTYYRRKHRERMMMTDIVGPAQNVQPIRSIIDLPAFLDPDEDVQTTATLERDGVFAQFMTFPPSNDLFGGAFDPTHAGWAAPVSDRWTYQLPANAPAGTYLVAMKARRTFMGEDIPASKVIEIQVGTSHRTEATLNTGPCNTCHNGPSALGTVLHAMDNRAVCASCHVPLGFELEGPIVVRLHFVHSRSAGRLDVPLSRCATCHLERPGIQRTSKAACLSCHKSYPSSHVQQFGPIEDMYIGGGRESFDACSTSCHTNHPNSGL